MKNLILIFFLLIGLSSKSQEKYIQFSDYPLEYTSYKCTLARFDIQTGKPYYVTDKLGAITFTFKSDSLITTHNCKYKLQNIHQWETYGDTEIKSYKAIDEKGEECYFSIIYKIKEDCFDMMVTYEKFMVIYTE